MTASGELGHTPAAALSGARAVLEAQLIVASGHLDPRTASLTARAGVRQVIEKPFDYLQLASALGEALRENS